MGIYLVVIDHHQNETVFLKNFTNIELIRGTTVKEFYKEARKHVNKNFDLVISDADPDGATSTIIYYLNKRISPRFKCMRNPLTKDWVQRKEQEGVKSVLTVDYFLWKQSDLEAFEKVIIINPVMIGFPNSNTSELIYQILPSKKPFVRDISTLGTICDYRIETAFPKIKKTIFAYKELFQELLPLLKTKKLTKYNIFQSSFQELTDMFWAPYVLKGEKGTQELVYKILQNPQFTLKELLTFSENKSVLYLQKHLKLYQKILSRELEKFEKRKIMREVFILYEIQTPELRFTSKLSSLICDKNPDKVIILKSKSKDGTYKYSLRRRDLNVNLGLITKITVEALGYPQGGGHPEAAGAAHVQDSSLFEEYFMREVKKHLI